MAETTQKVAIIVMFLLVGAMAADAPPTYKGLICMGWAKPEAQAVSDGDSSGEQLVVNTPLTESEKEQLYYANQESDAAFEKLTATENKILANHRLLFPSRNGSEWLRQGPCGDTPMIRSGEYHITQFVPSNPLYPSANTAIVLFDHGDASNCRSYFAEQRKHAVKAKYGSDANDNYQPGARGRR